MRKQCSVSDADKQRFEREVYPRVRDKGRWYFRQHGLRGEALREAIQEAQGIAWKYWVRSANARANPGPLSHYCCLQVADGRTLAGVNKGRSFDGIGAKRRGFKRGSLEDYVSYKEQPADIAQFRVDVPAWLATLPSALRRTAWLLIALWGTQAKDIARELGVSPGRLSQRRRELWERWNTFTA